MQCLIECTAWSGPVFPSGHTGIAWYPWVQLPVGQPVACLLYSLLKLLTVILMGWWLRLWALGANSSWSRARLFSPLNKHICRVAAFWSINQLTRLGSSTFVFGSQGGDFWCFLVGRFRGQFDHFLYTSFSHFKGGKASILSYFAQARGRSNLPSLAKEEYSYLSISCYGSHLWIGATNARSAPLSTAYINVWLIGAGPRLLSGGLYPVSCDFRLVETEIILGAPIIA